MVVCVSTFFLAPLCVQAPASLLYDEKHIIWTPSWQPANCQRASEAIQDQDFHPTDSWASPVKMRQAWATSAELSSWCVDSWVVIKVYYLKLLGVEVVCHEAIANCYSPCLFYSICLSTLVLIILCFSHALNETLLTSPQLCIIRFSRRSQTQMYAGSFSLNKIQNQAN